MPKKTRADHILFTQGLTESREQAKRLIMAGQVFVLAGNGKLRVEKPGQLFSPDACLEIADRERFVSRGGYKLLTALTFFSLNVRGLIALDAGASTGGFTDCLLQHGATKVYAVDVGKRQLHERLLRDPRVVGIEGVNLRTAAADLIPERVDLVVADLSFISLTLVLTTCMQWLKQEGLAAALIKPQFEVGPGGTHKGVVRDESLRKQAVDKVLAFAQESLGLSLVGVAPAAIKGAKGNQEYMAVWHKTSAQQY
ncbi:MAG: TlyA family RNA methyltransferase [Desulfovibrio sp.]|jgi:23S rRNA (cytidine1920-2'-O)/16S rRNA (cytidine1409-2'-O)-methyltransferase|nr:TlyA family RNA methyltransferase [Desulfovibrio sp.]